MPLSSVLFSALPSSTLLLTSYKCYSHFTLWPSWPVLFSPSNNISSPLSHIIPPRNWTPRPHASLCSIRAALKNHFPPVTFSLWFSVVPNMRHWKFLQTRKVTWWCSPEQGIDNVPWFISEPTQPPAHEVFCWKKSCVLLYTIMVRESAPPTHSSSVWQPNMDLLIWLEGLFSGSHLGEYHPLDVCKTSVLPGYHFATTLQGQEIPVTTFTV